MRTRHPERAQTAANRMRRQRFQDRRFSDQARRRDAQQLESRSPHRDRLRECKHQFGRIWSDIGVCAQLVRLDQSERDDDRSGETQGSESTIHARGHNRSILRALQHFSKCRASHIINKHRRHSSHYQMI